MEPHVEKMKNLKMKDLELNQRRKLRRLGLENSKDGTFKSRTRYQQLISARFFPLREKKTNKTIGSACSLSQSCFCQRWTR